MDQKLRIFLLLFTTGLLFTISGCCDDECVGDPCENVVCGENQECSNGNCVDVATNEIIKSGFITTNETWTSDKCYVLANKVVVQNDVTLTIEPGTLIKGREGQGSLATALIVARGGTIMANGTADKPIIFTSILDNIQIGSKSGTNLTASDNGKWGGVIILGKCKNIRRRR